MTNQPVEVEGIKTLEAQSLNLLWHFLQDFFIICFHNKKSCYTILHTHEQKQYHNAKHLCCIVVVCKNCVVVDGVHLSVFNMLCHKGISLSKKNFTSVTLSTWNWIVWQHSGVYAAIKLLGMSHSVADHLLCAWVPLLNEFPVCCTVIRHSSEVC